MTRKETVRFYKEILTLSTAPGFKKCIDEIVERAVSRSDDPSHVAAARALATMAAVSLDESSNIRRYARRFFSPQDAKDLTAPLTTHDGVIREFTKLF
jgi:hypothetical protein